MSTVVVLMSILRVIRDQLDVFEKRSSVGQVRPLFLSDTKTKTAVTHSHWNIKLN